LELLLVCWLRRNPLFAKAVVAVLGLGIGASTAAFSITDAVMLRPAADRAGRGLMRSNKILSGHLATERGEVRVLAIG